MYSDFHIHTHYSPDSEESPENIIKRCIELGMKHCCFTDHNDFGWPDSKECFELDADKYINELLLLKNNYKDKIDIGIGVECGITKDNYHKTNEFVNNYPFDFVIASCHIVNGMDPYYPEFFIGKSNRKAFEEYFNTLKDAVCIFDNFDVIGHIDYIVRYAPGKEAAYSAFDYSDQIDIILGKAISLGKGIEINTSGLKSGLSFANPCPDILKRYKELGGEIITMGSDAHSKEFVGYEFEKAAEILKRCGFNHYCIYKERKPFFVQL